MTPSEAFGQLTAVFDDWRGFLKDPQYVRRDGEITWANAAMSVLPVEVTRSDIADLSKRGQFTFRVSIDDSLIQIAYRFSRAGQIDAARLAFYETGVLVAEDDIEVGPWGEGVEDDSSILAKWVRFDYCHTGNQNVLHMDCHLHVSGLPGIRFAVTGIPTPKQFIEFVVSHFYPLTYQRHRLNDDQCFRDVTTIDRVNSVRVTPQNELTHLYSRMTHFRIPSA